MKGLILLSLILALINLSGCSARSRFIPSDDPNAASVDTYESKTEDGSLLSLSFRTIDSRPVMLGHSKDGYKLAPGKHHFLVEAQLTNGIWEAKSKMALIRIQAQLEENTLYRVRGNISENQITVWLEKRETGEISSEKVTGELRDPTVHESTEIYFLPQ